MRDIKSTVSGDLGKRYESEMPLLYMASALDPRFKALPFLKEETRQEVYTKITMEASKSACKGKLYYKKC